jgi:1-acyl-sn-glycerol-3-phosphate acyltransferase
MPMVKYPAFPLPILFRVAWALLRGRQRSFRQDALRCIHGLRMDVRGVECIPQAGPGVVLMNHYWRPGFFAAWIGLGVGAAVPVDMVWVMSSAWTDADTLWTRIKAAASVPLYPRLARLYGFVSMPPMPPRPHETAARARAVRQILAAARQDPPALIAIAPEGQDSPKGKLMRPHPGVGRMLAKLADGGFLFYPVGVYEEGMELIVHFGPGFRLALPAELSVGEIDRAAADQAMLAIAACLPPGLGGAYT